MPKTPAQVAASFGCTEKQARDQMKNAAENLRAMASLAKRSKTGKFRGATAERWEERAAALETTIAQSEAQEVEAKWQQKTGIRNSLFI